VTPLRHALSDDHFAVIAPSLPTNDRPGHPWKDHRRVIDGILWILHTGAPWRDLPRQTYGPWQTAYERFNRRSQDGTRGRILQALHARLDERGKIDRELFCIDGSSVRASRAAAGASPTDGTAAEPSDHALGRSRGGFGSKIHPVCDGNGLPMAVTVTAGQRKDQRRLPSFDEPTYRRRNVVERCIGWQKERRRPATRFEKLAENFLAMVKLAMLERLLKALLPDSA
jgi:transposase